MRKTRIVNNKIVPDTRKFYNFVLVDGRTAETKAESRAEAISRIENLPGIKLKEVV